MSNTATTTFIFAIEGDHGLSYVEVNEGSDCATITCATSSGLLSNCTPVYNAREMYCDAKASGTLRHV